MSSLKESFSGFGLDLLQSIRGNAREHLEEAAFEERMSLVKVIQALRELGHDEHEIVRVLQKYWDLRLSEAEELLSQEK